MTFLIEMKTNNNHWQHHIIVKGNNLSLTCFKQISEVDLWDGSESSDHHYEAISCGLEKCIKSNSGGMAWGYPYW